MGFDDGCGVRGRFSENGEDGCVWTTETDLSGGSCGRLEGLELDLGCRVLFGPAPLSDATTSLGGLWFRRKCVAIDL